jgi:hypothetical protein
VRAPSPFCEATPTSGSRHTAVEYCGRVGWCLGRAAWPHAAVLRHYESLTILSPLLPPRPLGLATGHGAMTVFAENHHRGNEFVASSCSFAYSSDHGREARARERAVAGPSLIKHRACPAQPGEHGCCTRSSADFCWWSAADYAEGGEARRAFRSVYGWSEVVGACAPRGGMLSRARARSCTAWYGPPPAGT